jgi:hypothetical protein
MTDWPLPAVAFTLAAIAAPCLRWYDRRTRRRCAAACRRETR